MWWGGGGGGGGGGGRGLADSKKNGRKAGPYLPREKDRSGRQGDGLKYYLKLGNGEKGGGQTQGGVLLSCISEKSIFLAAKKRVEDSSARRVKNGREKERGKKGRGKRIGGASTRITVFRTS